MACSLSRPEADASSNIIRMSSSNMTSTILDLPSELLLQTATWVSRSRRGIERLGFLDLSSFRLACSLFAQSGLRVIVDDIRRTNMKPPFKHVSVKYNMTTHSIDIMEAVALNTVLALRVDTIIFDFSSSLQDLLVSDRQLVICRSRALRAHACYEDHLLRLKHILKFGFPYLGMFQDCEVKMPQLSAIPLMHDRWIGLFCLLEAVSLTREASAKVSLPLADLSLFSAGPEYLPLAHKAFSLLRRICLGFDHCQLEEYAIPGSRGWSTVLESAAGLQHLSLTLNAPRSGMRSHLEPNGRVSRTPSASVLRTLISHKWDKLRFLDLAGFEIWTPDVEHLLISHKATLIGLKIARVRTDQHMWRHLLDTMRENLTLKWAIVVFDNTIENSEEYEQFLQAQGLSVNEFGVAEYVLKKSIFAACESVRADIASWQSE